jgi:hypothetical protein
MSKYGNSLTSAGHDFWLDFNYRVAQESYRLGASNPRLYIGHA